MNTLKERYKMKQPTKLNTNANIIDGIHYHNTQDWTQWVGSLVDESNDIDRVYTDLLLWQLCNSTHKSIQSFAKNAQYWKDQLESTFTDERQAPDGTEISTINHDNMVEQGKTWKALEDKYTAIHKACSNLYQQLYQMKWTERKIEKPSKGKMRTQSNMTPEEKAEKQRIVSEMMGF